MSRQDDQDILQFLYRENQLLDTGRYEEWLALFEVDGVYWIPASAGQEDSQQEISILYEDPVLMGMRIGRMRHPGAHGLAMPIRTSRMLGNVQVSERPDGLVQAEGCFILHEWQDERMRVFAGSVRYHLKPESDSYRIALKRVDLLNVDHAFEAIQIIL